MRITNYPAACSYDIRPDVPEYAVTLSARVRACLLDSIEGLGRQMRCKPCAVRSALRYAGAVPGAAGSGCGSFGYLFIGGIASLSALDGQALLRESNQDRKDLLCPTMKGAVRRRSGLSAVGEFSAGSANGHVSRTGRRY